MANKWQPPRGIRFEERQDRPKPFGLHWRENGKRKSKFFASGTDRERFAKSLVAVRKVSGTNARTWDSQEMDEWRRFRKDTDNAPLEDIVRCWQQFGQSSGGSLISELIPRFKEEKFAEGISADMRTQYKNHLERFIDVFGDRRMDSVSPSDLLKWLQSLPYQPITRKNHRKTIRALYNWAGDRGYCRTNPAKIVKDEKEVKDIEILTVEEGRKLFEANMDSPGIGRLALEAFGMLRYSSAKRLRCEDINWEERGITLPASQIKTARRKYADGHPDNLWQWLEYAPKECWSMTERQYQEEKRFCFGRARVRHPHNCLRHSACTYHYAAFKDPGLTASLMAHTNLRTMEQFYRGRATQSDGLGWFDIKPSTLRQKGGKF